MEPNTLPAPVRGLAAASVSLGFFSMVVFWWFPFGLILSTVGLSLGLICMLLGIKGGLRGENLALLGTCLSGFSFTMILTLTHGIRILFWDH
jgi:hypothetical protein